MAQVVKGEFNCICELQSVTVSQEIKRCKFEGCRCEGHGPLGILLCPSETTSRTPQFGKGHKPSHEARTWPEVV